MTDVKTISKFLSYILRHKPDSIGLYVDPYGWADINSIIEKSDLQLTKDGIVEVVATSEKKRFSLSVCGTKIRANQGHSFPVNLGLKPQIPPDILYHGTAEKNVQLILNQGLHKANRQYVHLSTDINTAKNVGMRHGKPMILSIDAKTMSDNGYEFYLSDNEVWLCDHVPSKYLNLTPKSP